MATVRLTRAERTRVHKERFLDALDEINNRLKLSLPSANTYRRAIVFAMHWENDDLNVGPIETDLLKLFRRRYGFTTESCIIPSGSKEDASMVVFDQLRSVLTKYNAPDNLFILYYSGHSASTLSNGLVLYGNQRTSVNLHWDLLHNCLLMFTRVDQLVILDSCKATEALSDRHNASYESLFASSREDSTTGCIPDSFTRRFMDTLEALPPTGDSIPRIHARMIRSGRAPATALDTTPVYAAHPSKPPITLCPLLNREVAGLHGAAEEIGERVLITVAIRGVATIPDVTEWLNWIASEVPENIGGVHLEGVFESNSDLCFFSVPLEAWNMMQNDPAFELVAFVRSRNKVIDASIELAQRPDVSDPHAGLPLRPHRPDTRAENIPPHHPGKH